MQIVFIIDRSTFDRLHAKENSSSSSHLNGFVFMKTYFCRLSYRLSNQSFHPKWWSHKLDAAGIRYELDNSLDTADIVRINGPYQCGYFLTSPFFGVAWKTQLDGGERVIADNWYIDDMCKTPDTLFSPIPTLLHSQFPARNETSNKSLKQFVILTSKFHHEVWFHGSCFRAVTNIVVQRRW